MGVVMETAPTLKTTVATMDVTVVMGTMLTIPLLNGYHGIRNNSLLGHLGAKRIPPGVAACVRVLWQRFVALIVPQPIPRKHQPPIHFSCGI